MAPIALYPDALIAQILGAATYPDEVVKAEEWMEKHKHLEGDKLAKEVNKEHWDAGVKALTQFPAVLANMNQNLAWTSMHGYYFRAVANRRTDGKIAGGFTFVAYPAEYRGSGVMTFIITEKNVVKEKDLGTNTLALARSLGWSHNETGWVPADDK